MLVDWRGDPIESGALDAPQTAAVAALHREFGSHPARGLTPRKLHQIFTEAETGHLVRQAELFEDMEERDTQIQADLGIRRRALLTLDWQIEPPRDASAAEKSAAAEAQEWLEDIPEIEDSLLDMLSAIGHGFSCLEIEWGVQGKARMPRALHFRPQSWFTVDRDTRSELRLRAPGVADGEALQPFGWVVHRHQAKSGYLARGGLFRTLAWPYLYRNYSARDLAEFLEIYGLPLRLGRYHTTATPQEKATLMQAVISIGHAAAGIIPQGMEVEFHEAAKGSHDPHIAMIEWCERSISKSILGRQIGQDSARKGSLAGAEVDNEVRLDILKSDARQLAATITRDLLWPFFALNKGYTDPSRAPRMVFDVRDPVDLKLYAESLPKLVDSGLPVPISWAQAKLSIPAPKDGEAVLQPSRQPTGLPPQSATLRSALRAGPRGFEGPQAALAAELSSAAEDAHGAMIEQILDISATARSLPELRDALLAAYGDLDSDRLGEVMALAFEAAQAAGRYDVAIDAGQIQG